MFAQALDPGRLGGRAARSRIGVRARSIKLEDLGVEDWIQHDISEFNLLIGLGVDKPRKPVQEAKPSIDYDLNICGVNVQP
jgi:hypothetical protein